MKDGGPNIIDAMRVIGMIMCKKHRINSIKSSCEHLFSMVRRSIDDDNGFAMGPCFLEKYRAATTPVFGIIRIARAPTRYRSRDATGRAASENGQR
jgi:hypothetical protein